MRARTKVPEEIDPELICCEELAQLLRDWAGVEIELTEPIFTGSARCVHCGKRQPRLRYATLVGRNPFRSSSVAGKVSVVALAFVDLDEGPGESVGPASTVG